MKNFVILRKGFKITLKSQFNLSLSYDICLYKYYFELGQILSLNLKLNVVLYFKKSLVR